MYQLVRWLLGLTAVLVRRDLSKDAKLLVLGHENAVLRRQITRVHYTPADSPRSICDSFDLLIPASPAITRSPFFRGLRISRSRRPIVRASSSSSTPNENPLLAGTPCRCPGELPRGGTSARR